MSVELSALSVVEPTVAEIKAGLPVDYVLFRAGVILTDDNSALCPFHDDHEPSLDIFSPNRWNCPPCGRGGDVLDLLAEFAPGLNFPQRMTWAARLMREMYDSNEWHLKVHREKTPFDVELGSAAVAEAWDQELHSENLGKFIEAKNLDLSIAALRSWGVGVSGSKLVIPYWSGDGDLRTYRIRSLDGSDKPRSAPGTHAPTFYGEWRDSRLNKVVICEGESDTWSAAWALRDLDIDVLGVPGAGRPPFGLDRLHGRTVLLAFDGDLAGRAAADRWMAALKEVNSDGSHQWRATIIRMPDGRDLSSLTLEEIRAMVAF